MMVNMQNDGHLGFYDTIYVRHECSGPQAMQKHKLSISVRQPQKRGGIYIFDSHFVFRSLEGGCRIHFGFFS